MPSEMATKSWGQEQIKTPPLRDSIGSRVQAIDPRQERRLVRKLDLHIVPIVMLLYTFRFLDRVNIGSARLYGLERDLQMNSRQYNTAVSVLFVAYVLSELPSNLILKHYVRPSRWLAFITTAWGIVATLTGIVQSYAGLIVCRVILGVFESGLFPGCAIYLTFFYTKHELALRIGYLFVSAALAGAFGGLLAFAIGHMDGLAGQSGWRWILILEGLPTVILGIVCWSILPDEAETAHFLDEDDRALVRERRAAQQGVSDDFEWSDVRKGLRDWKIWAFAFGQFGMDTMLYGYSTFLPTIIRGIRPGSSAAVVQVLTIPCYALGAASYMIAASVSDSLQSQGPIAIIFGIISIIGYAMLVSDTSSGVHHASCFLVAMGLYVAMGIPLAWLPSNSPRYGKRTTATALQFSVANCAGILSSFLYPTSQGPRFIRGHAVSLSMVAFDCIVFGFMHLWLKNENKQRDRRSRSMSQAVFEEVGHDGPEGVAKVGDEHPDFRFTT